MSEMTLYDPQGNRLYLNAEERAAFLTAARQRPARDRIVRDLGDHPLIFLNIVFDCPSIYSYA
jgi:hypothetical protein